MSDLATQLRVTADVNDAWQDVGPIAALLREAADELERLERWKDEAMTVLVEWNKVWEAAGCPGQLGGSIAEAVHEWVRSRT